MDTLTRVEQEIRDEATRLRQESDRLLHAAGLIRQERGAPALKKRGRPKGSTKAKKTA